MKSASCRAESAAQKLNHLVGRDDLLALEVAAALGCDLIFQQDSGGTRSLELTDRAHDVMQIAVARVAVGHHRDGDSLGRAANGVGHFRQGQETDVRQSQKAGGGAEAAQENGLQPRGLDQACREDVSALEATNNARLI